MQLSKKLIALGLLATSFISSATVVKFETNQGDFEVNLFDQQAPKTVENFLAYVESEAYVNTIIHRSVANFVVQGGGFVIDEEKLLDEVASLGPVVNEPGLSNVRGTIAMAKLGGNANSATNQWFFNLNNNASNLDNQNGGFTVFGQVIGDGMEVIDSIADLPRYSLSGLTDFPLKDYTATDVSNNVEVTPANFVTIYRITVIDSATVTYPEIVPVQVETSGTDSSGGGSSGGGSTNILMLLLGALVVIRRIGAR